MIKFAIRVLISALVFAYILPFVDPGVHLNGAFWPEAVVCGVVFAGVAWLVRQICRVFIVLTAGLGAFVLIFAFWLVPAVTLQMTAYFAPTLLSVSGWPAAIGAGLIFLVINWLTTESGTK